LKKLAIITTHPIQYNAPLFRLLTERTHIDIKVFYTWSQSATGTKFDPGFGQNIKWDIPLLDGYDFAFVNNISKKPGSHHYKGIDNPTLLKEIQEWGANAVLIYGWSFKSHFKAMRYFKNKIPVLFRGDSTLLDEKPGLKKVLRRSVLKHVYSFVDIALYAGVANKAYFIAHGMKDRRLVFMPHAIDNSRFAANELNSNTAKQLRQALLIPAEATVFLFAGKLEKKKQPNFLIESFVALNSSNVYLIIAGSGQFEDTLKEAYSSHPFIKFIGFQNQIQMPAVYNCCDVFVLPSKGPNETWGLAINEAMAAGKAIIASDKCGASYDLIHNNKNGFVFSSNESTTFIQALKFFENNKIETKMMGNTSSDIIKEYSFLHQCNAIEGIVKIIEKSTK